MPFIVKLLIMHLLIMVFVGTFEKWLHWPKGRQAPYFMSSAVRALHIAHK